MKSGRATRSGCSAAYCGCPGAAYHDYRAGKSHVVSPRKAALGERVRAVCNEHRRRYGARRTAAELRDFRARRHDQRPAATHATAR